MKKISVVLLALFFSGYINTMNGENVPAVFDTEEQRRLDVSYPAPDGLPALLLHDPEVRDWIESHELLESLQLQLKTKRTILKVASATKRSAEAAGIGVMMWGIYLANTFPSKNTIFEDDTCTFNMSLP